MAPWVAALLAFCLGISETALAQSGVPEGISLPTELRVQAPGWWPTKGDRGRDEYIGSAECAKCHAEKAASFRTTAMAHAASPAAASEMLQQHNPLNLRLDPFSYRIEGTGQNSL